jgi:ligand-binding sensor domain-containing protein
MILRRFTDFPAVWRARAQALAAFLALFAFVAAEAADSAKANAWPDAAMHPAQFAQITVEAGLSSVDVRSIAQDQQGFLWFGTNQTGLNRYDGREIKVYQNDPADPGSLSQNYIWALLVDRHGVLWVGTAGGLDRYDRERDAFDHFRHDPRDASTLPHNFVLCLFEDSGGDL